MSGDRRRAAVLALCAAGLIAAATVAAVAAHAGGGRGMPARTPPPTRTPAPTLAPTAGHVTITFNCVPNGGCNSVRFDFHGWGPAGHGATVVAGGTSHMTSWSGDATAVTYGWRGGPAGGRVYAAWDDGGGSTFVCRPVTVRSPTTC
ncbi:MAG: hypothetical protein JWM18_285 [Chloroflexi bacterium]|nr:hypothetical protein [Chloroflexota bacterium]